MVDSTQYMPHNNFIWKAKSWRKGSSRHASTNSPTFLKKSRTSSSKNQVTAILPSIATKTTAKEGEHSLEPSDHWQIGGNFTTKTSIKSTPKAVSITLLLIASKRDAQSQANASASKRLTPQARPTPRLASVISWPANQNASAIWIQREKAW